MGFLLDLLTFPVLGVPRALAWIGEKVVEEANGELYDEDRVRNALLELQLDYDLGDVSEKEYVRQETILLQRLNSIREANSK